MNQSFERIIVRINQIEMNWKLDKSESSYNNNWKNQEEKSFWKKKKGKVFLKTKKEIKLFLN